MAIRIFADEWGAQVVHLVLLSPTEARGVNLSWFAPRLRSSRDARASDRFALVPANFPTPDQLLAADLRV